MVEIIVDEQLSLYEIAQSYINREDFEKKLEEVRGSTQDIVDQVSPGGNSLLHAAAHFGNRDITEYLAQKFPGLIVLKNHAGDTALHSAAKAGKAETTDVLRQFPTDPTSSSPDDVPLRRKNLEGNTALHEAVIHYNFANDYDKKSYIDVATKMVSADPGLAYIANKEGKSPLCLAVETTDLKIVRCLLDCPPPTAGDCQQGLPEGKSPVDVAIELKLKNIGMLKEMLNKRDELRNSTNANGRKALHCAASVGNMEAIEFLLKKYPRAIKERDNEGHYPLHVACESGYVKAFNRLLEQWPYISEYLNNKCQNVLHVAAKNGRDYMVRRIVKDRNVGPQLVNAKDTEGNTPLHLAALHGHSLVVGTLLLTRKCDSQILNQEGLTAYEIAKERAGDPMDSGPHMVQGKEQGNMESIEQRNVQREDVPSKNTKRPDSTDSMMALSILFLLQVFKISCGRRQRHRMKRLRHEMKIKRAKMEDMKDRINALLVVATLIAGMAFQAAVQMTDNGDDKGVNSESKSGAPAPTPDPAPAPSTSPPLPWFKRLITDQLELTYLQLFTFFDTLAINLAIFAAITLCWVQLVDVNFLAFFVWKASILLGASLYCICIAFGFAMLIGIKEFGDTYRTVMLVVEALFIQVLTVFTSPLFIPFGLKYLFIRGLYAAFFVGYFIVHRLLDCCLFRFRKA